MLNEYIVAHHYLNNILRDDTGSCWLAYNIIEKNTTAGNNSKTADTYRFRGLQSILTLIARRYIYHGEDIAEILPQSYATSLEHILYARDMVVDWCTNENSQWYTFVRNYCQQKADATQHEGELAEYTSIKEAFHKYIGRKYISNSDGSIANTTGMYYSKGNDKHNYMKSWHLDSIIADALQLGELKRHSIALQSTVAEQIRLSNLGTAGFKQKQPVLVDMIIDIIQYVLTHNSCNGYAHVEFQDFVNYYNRPNRHDIEKIKNAQLLVDGQHQSIFVEKKLEILDTTLLSISDAVLGAILQHNE